MNGSDTAKSGTPVRFICPNEDRPWADPPQPAAWRDSAGRCPVTFGRKTTCGQLVCASCGRCQSGHRRAASAGDETEGGK